MFDSLKTSALTPFALLPLLALVACGGEPSEMSEGTSSPAAGPFQVTAGEPFPDVPEEVHLRNVRQLTFEGENAEAYFSPDGTKLITVHDPIR